MNTGIVIGIVFVVISALILARELIQFLRGDPAESRPATPPAKSGTAAR